jgi:hypothetical protein
MNKGLRLLRLATLVVTLVLAACDGQAAPTVAPPTQPAATAVGAGQAAPTVVPSTQPAATVAPPTQPAATAVGAGQAAPTAAPPTQPAATAVGALPVFSKPSDITNPYFPVSSVGQSISLGTEGGESVREEVTLLPDVKTISWAGGNTQVRVVQFVAYGDGKLVEIAYDYLAQADNGDVYYFGEDVANYEDGQVADHKGSWLAGKDGAPPALIMPANPQVGMVFNPENLPGVVYETDEVISLSEKVTTPSGPISDGLLIKETLMDSSIEYKIWAAGFGIVEDRSDDGKVNLVLFDRADAAPRVVPGSLQTIEAQAEAIIDAAPGGNRATVTGDVAAIAEAWKAYQVQAAADGAPQVFQEALASAFDHLQQASSANDVIETLQAANDLSAAVIDLFGVYHPAMPADIGRLDVLERQVVLDISSNDFAAAAHSLAKVDAIWARLKPSILEHNGAEAATQLDASLAAQRAAWKGKDRSGLTADAKNGLEIVDALEELY